MRREERRSAESGDAPLQDDFAENILDDGILKSVPDIFARRGNAFAEGRVLALAEGGRLAYVRLVPEGSCRGCAHEGAARFPADAAPCGGCGRLFASARPEDVLLAENPLAARPGQRVLLSSRRGYRLLAGGLIFFFPLLVFFAAYALGAALFDGHASGAFGLACAAVIVYYSSLFFLEKRKQKNTRPVWIERVLEDSRADE